MNWKDLSSEKRSLISFAELCSKALGYNVVLEKNKKYNGFITKDNTIHIDINARNTVNYVDKNQFIPTSSHEITHSFERTAPELYRKLEELVISTLLKDTKNKGKTELALIAEEIVRLDSKHPEKKHSEKDARSEIVARACEDMLSMSKEGRKMFESLSESEQKTFVDKVKEIIKNIKEWIDELLGQYSSTSTEAKILRQYDEQLNEISKLWDEMLVQSKKLNEAGVFKAEKNTTTDGGVEYSEREIIGVSGTNYGIGVYLDSNLLTGLTESERKEMVKEFVVSELAGQHFIAYDNNNNPVDISIAKRNARVKNAKGKSKKVVEELYRKNIDADIKQEAVVLADELVKTATYKNSTPAAYSHGWLDNNGKNDWEYWKVYIQEKNKSVWEATLNIANTANGEKILYDIDPIKMAEQAVKSATSTTKDIIHNPDEFVNTKFSDRDNTV